MATINHPIQTGTMVQYLSPRCACSGKKYEIVNGTIKQTVKNGSKYRYIFDNEKNAIPSEAIISILS